MSYNHLDCVLALRLRSRSSYRELQYVDIRYQHRRNPKIQYSTIIPDSRSSSQVKYIIRKRIDDEHLDKNGFDVLKNDYRGDSNERNKHKKLQASFVQCSVNMESEKWTHILNFITAQLKENLTGILVSRCCHI